MDNAGYKLQNVTTTKLGRFAVVRGQVVREGGAHPYSFLHEKACVCICPVVGQDVRLIRQYRYAVDEWCLELPCGVVEDGEQPLDAAARELQEETGCVPERLTSLGDCYARAGISDCRVSFYLAECSQVRKQELDPTEQIECVCVPLHEFDDMVRTGQFSQLMGVACWVRAKSALRADWQPAKENTGLEGTDNVVG